MARELARPCTCIARACRPLGETLLAALARIPDVKPAKVSSVMPGAHSINLNLQDIFAPGNKLNLLTVAPLPPAAKLADPKPSRRLPRSRAAYQLPRSAANSKFDRAGRSAELAHFVVLRWNVDFNQPQALLVLYAVRAISRVLAAIWLHRFRR